MVGEKCCATVCMRLMDCDRRTLCDVWCDDDRLRTMNVVRWLCDGWCEMFALLLANGLTMVCVCDDARPVDWTVLFFVRDWCDENGLACVMVCIFDRARIEKFCDELPRTNFVCAE